MRRSMLIFLWVNPKRIKGAVVEPSTFILHDFVFISVKLGSKACYTTLNLLYWLLRLLLLNRRPFLWDTFFQMTTGHYLFFRRKIVGGRLLKGSSQRVCISLEVVENLIVTPMLIWWIIFASIICEIGTLCFMRGSSSLL